MAQINKPNEYFNTKLYTGNFTDNRDITGVGFQPDLVWLKERSSTSSHLLQDSVRGANKDLFSDTTSAEESNTNRMKAFISDGFTLGAHNLSNQNGETYASWNWLAGGTASSNTDGSITSNVSASTTSGFSVVTWTGNGTAGSTVGHGLNSEMKFMILKDYSLSRSWLVYHQEFGGAGGMSLNTTNAADTSNSGYWNSTDATSSVFSTGTYSNENNSNYICYCFSEKKGFSKFGSYTGNGNADGTFVYTGFKPSFVLVKRTDTAGYEWSIWDNKRDPFNLADTTLRPNSSASESTIGSFYQIDMLSQGYKFRTSNGDVNASGATYIYMAFAEQPLTGTNGVPCTAR